jgi:hypothetical protein
VVALTGLFNMQVHVSGVNRGFACPFKGLTMLQAIQLHYAVPVTIGAMLLLSYTIGRIWQRSTAGSNNAQREQQYQVASTKAMTLAFSTILTTTFELLHCIDNVSGSGEHRLFRAGSVACGTWQAPYYVLAAVLLLPVVLALASAAGAKFRPLSARLSAAATASLRAPYRADCGYWEAVLALHRLSVVAVHSFVANSADGALLQVFLCLVAFVLHSLWHPFEADSSNRSQAVLLCSLVVVALLNVPQAVFDSNTEAVSATMQRRLEQMAGMEEVLILAPSCVVGVSFVALVWRRRREIARAAAADIAVGIVALRKCICAAPIGAYHRCNRRSDDITHDPFDDEPLLDLVGPGADQDHEEEM